MTLLKLALKNFDFRVEIVIYPKFKIILFLTVRKMNQKRVQIFGSKDCHK